MLTTLAFAAALSLVPPQADTANFDGQALVSEALAKVRPAAYRTAQVDWPALETELRDQAATARDSVDMLPVYRRLLEALEDGHSYVQPTDEMAKAYETRAGRDLYGDVVREPRRSPFKSRWLIEHRQIEISDRKAAQWIAVPKAFGADEPARMYAAHMFLAVANVFPNTCGYILDVRGNSGGNIWPMLTGLSGLLGDGPAGREAGPDGRISTYAELREGAAIIVQEGESKGQELIRSTTWRPLPTLVSAPVALLMDDLTASSGEGVVVAFKGRPNTRTFGQPSFGVSTSNNVFPLSDGVTLVVTVGVMADRDGATYPKGLQPDETVAYAPGSGDRNDSQVEAARAWLASHPACAAPPRDS